MATSPKKKTSQTIISRTKRRYFGLTLLFTITLILAIYVMTQQTKSTEVYRKYIEVYGKIQKNDEEINKFMFRGDEKNKTRSENKEQVKSISILGERNSGTTWMYEHLNDCFNHSIPVKRRLTRYKHWFQDENIGVPIISGTLVLTIVRNPFEWVEAMRKKPHHAPNHMFIKDWKQFVATPWTMNRVGKDLEMSDEEKMSPTACQERFMYKDLISCHLYPYPEGTFNKTHYSEHQPFYEMRYDGSGEPFKDILEMRAAKIRNFLSTKYFHGVDKLWILQYETLVESGTSDLIEKIEKLTGAKSLCVPSPPQLERKKRGVDRHLMDYLMNNLDWDAENLVGYHKTGLRKTIFN